MKIGEFLQKYIDENNISQAELSRRSGVPASTISSIINRNNERVAIEMMLKLCEVLNCDINEYINTLKSSTYSDTSNVAENIKKAPSFKAEGDAETIPVVMSEDDWRTVLNQMSESDIDALLDYARYLLWKHSQAT